MNSSNPIIEWSKKSGQDCLKFTFGEKLTLEEAGRAIQEWKNAFLTKSGTSVILIWDCSVMKHYDNDAKKIWMNALNDMKSQITSIWLITDSPFIKMGALIMGAFCAHKINAVSSEDEIEI